MGGSVRKQVMTLRQENVLLGRCTKRAENGLAYIRPRYQSSNGAPTTSAILRLLAVLHALHISSKPCHSYASATPSSIAPYIYHQPTLLTTDPEIPMYLHNTSASFSIAIFRHFIHVQDRVLL